jgi:hypothetical protein
MPNHESHGHHGPGHHGHGPMGGSMRGPVQFFMVNAVITQMFARVWMVISAVALMKMASTFALNSRVKMMKELRDDLSQEQRDALLDDIWRRARRKRMGNCPVLPPYGSSETGAED